MKYFGKSKHYRLVDQNLKLVLSAILICVQLASGFAIVSYEISDRLYNWSENGLTLMSRPDVNSEVITRLEFGQEMISLSRKTRYDYQSKSIAIVEKFVSRDPKKQMSHISVDGAWIKVKVENFTGYIHDSYLSKLKTPDQTKSRAGIKSYLQYQCEVYKYLQKLDTLKESGCDKIIFQNGFHLTIHYGSGGGNLKLIAADYSKEEALLLVHYMRPYWKNIQMSDDEVLLITYDDSEFQIKVCENIVIVEGDWGC